MDDSNIRMVDLFGLKGQQRTAVLERSCDLAVTAGAGSGKTRTLVTRYLSLLCDGLLPRQIVAITFTEKASREMRSRSRQWLKALIAQPGNPEAPFWSSMDAQMDSARIGTIHSLCSEILRNHPAEARLDPRFKVLDENQAAALRASAVKNALAWAVQEPGMEGIFRIFNLRTLERLLSTFLVKRLDISAGSFDPSQLSVQISHAVTRFLHDDLVTSILSDLRRSRSPASDISETDDAMASQACEIITSFDEAEACLRRQEPLQSILALFNARRSQMRLNVGKRSSQVKDSIQSLRNYYDKHLDPWLGGSDSKHEPPNPLIEQVLVDHCPLVKLIYEKTLTIYRISLDELSSLDFDDLEAGTVNLLRLPAIRSHWQNEIRAVLVDEFQDTNTRQREIILGLTGEIPGRLFVVGDARQSIYRFRGADVTVFTELQTQIAAHGGKNFDLDRTFRAHSGLIKTLDALVEPILRMPDPQRPYHIPYSRLAADRTSALPQTQAPFVECILGAAEDSESARPEAARALAQHLMQLYQQGQIQSWDEVALLFRASTTFPVYEGALEDAGIPFVTVAGSGFYDRPEVRDLLNMLRAIADPWDDQALAGLLRSPAFAISDVGLYQLRRAHAKTRPLYKAMQEDTGDLSPSDRERTQRALALLDDLAPWVDRLPVAGLLNQLINRTDYRAILATCANIPGSSRLWRNVDKLVSDAQSSGQMRVNAFLNNISTMRDIGAREAEASSEAEGAVRLMTIHKSKGLEFNVVVLADAAHRPNPGRGIAFRMDDVWTFSPDKLPGSPLGFRLAKWQDSLQSEAEDLRLLYVALTRAKEKLIINGHLRLKDGRGIADGWLGKIFQSGGIQLETIIDQPGKWIPCPLPGEAGWSIWLSLPGSHKQSHELTPESDWPESTAKPLFEPLSSTLIIKKSPEEFKKLRLSTRTPPAHVVGEMIHKALQRWRFPGHPLLLPMLRTQAQQNGVLGEGLIHRAVIEVEKLLKRFQKHPLFTEIDLALERHSEVPFTGLTAQGSVEWGFMDCLYRTSGGWILVDFKTDCLRDPQGLAAAVERYLPQLLSYRQAAEKMVGSVPSTRLCFLNVENQVTVIEL